MSTAPTESSNGAGPAEPAGPVGHAGGGDGLAWRSRAAVLRFGLVFVIVLAADLVSKHLAFAHVADLPVDMDLVREHGIAAIPGHEPIIVVPRVLGLRLTLNEGAIFGLGAGGRWIFVTIGSVALLVVVGLFARSRPGQWVTHLALASILAGAIGNLVDRVLYGMVRDLLWLFPGVELPFGWSWPGSAGTGLYPWIFNVADAALVVGVALIAIGVLRAPAEPASRTAADTKL